MESARGQVDEVRVKKEQEEAVVDEIMTGLHAATAELRQKLEEAQVTLAAAERDVAGLQSKKEAVLTQIQLTESRRENAAKAIVIAKEKQAKLQQEKDTLVQRQSSVEEESVAVEVQAEGCAAALVTHNTEEQRLTRQLQQTVVEAEAARASRNQQQAQGNKHHIVTALMQAAKKGGVLAGAGVRGRLGDLASIAAEYDVAVRSPTHCLSIFFDASLSSFPHFVQICYYTFFVITLFLVKNLNLW